MVVEKHQNNDEVDFLSILNDWFDGLLLLWKIWAKSLWDLFAGFICVLNLYGFFFSNLYHTETV